VSYIRLCCSSICKQCEWYPCCTDLGTKLDEGSSKIIVKFTENTHAEKTYKGWQCQKSSAFSNDEDDFFSNQWRTDYLKRFSNFYQPSAFKWNFSVKDLSEAVKANCFWTGLTVFRYCRRELKLKAKIMSSLRFKYFRGRLRKLKNDVKRWIFYLALFESENPIDFIVRQQQNRHCKRIKTCVTWRHFKQTWQQMTI